MGLSDFAGLIGVTLMLAAYGAVSLGRIDPTKALALGANLIGSILVIYSLVHDFNLSAFIMEVAWGVVAIVGLARLALKRRR